MTKPAILALADGSIFRGEAIGADGQTVGEVVFNTAMTGYQEILTDPSYAQQIVTLTYPHIGNTGTTPEDAESNRVWSAGLVIRDLPLLASNWRNTQSLPEYTDWEGVRLHVVTGKGGTGKTTVAAALALALASGGRRVLLIEVEGRQGIAQVFDCPPLPYGERKVAVAPGTTTRPGGGEVYALAADPEAALLEYLEMYYKLRHAGTALARLGVVDFATTIAPGVRDVLLTGKAAEAARRKDAGGYRYDAVVMDAPPTGQIGRFLNVTAEISGLARVGPIRAHAETVRKVISSPATAVHFVTLLEEMPVQETLDGVAELTGLGLQPGGIIINMVQPPLSLPADQLRATAHGAVDTAELAAGLKAAGIDDDGRLAADLATELIAQAQTITAAKAQRRRLAGAGQPRYDLPLIPYGMDLAGLYRLAAALREQGAA